MCGIGGWFVRQGVDWRPSKELIAAMIKGIENRGRDATGYGTLTDDGDLFAYKGAMPAWKYTTEFLKEDLPVGRIGLVHCRAANVGSPDNNENNHPIGYASSTRRVMVVHNGTVGNLEKCYEKLKIRPEAEVDSALFAAALGELGPHEGLKFMASNSCGSGAIAAVYDDGTLVMARDLSPLFVAMPQEGVLLWSSESEPMRAMSERDSSFGIPFCRVWGVADSKYFIWDGNGQVVSKGDWRLASMSTGTTPTYMKGKGSHTAHQTDQGNPTRPSGASSPAPISEFQKHMGFKPPVPVTDAARGLVDGRPIETVRLPVDQTDSLGGAVGPRSLGICDLTDRRNPANRQKMEKECRVPCSWAGCWKLARDKVLWNNSRWIPLCDKHGNRWQKKGHNIVVSDSHEMARKVTQIVKTTGPATKQAAKK